MTGSRSFEHNSNDIEELRRQNAALKAENHRLRAQLPGKVAADDADGPFAERDATEEFEAVLELLPVGIAIAYDARCFHMRTNAAFNRMLGLTSGESASKTGPVADHLPFRVLCDGKEVAADDLPMQVAAREGIAVEGSRCEIHRADGRISTMYGMVRPLFDKHGNPRGSVGVFMDVTEREMLVRDLRTALAEVRTLRGMLPICAHCKEIRDPDGTWSQLEVYLRSNSEATFTHTICPKCMEGVLAEFPA